ncbi:GntR family transcriptional regulator [Kitasatospora viridis]|uniref:TetR family transcriptional regulator n=1 Tax=Kitasatospora viridis TaxID=281105 RepID=A0A561ULI7_9ACTN|nr:GntR family transcriptional regulator [Kitasatospora viridis]TWG00233.1 TetR family transcriptional regulator [Kitasatospora viridis]
MTTHQELPPYLTIAAELRQRITDGALRPGDKVPSTRQLTKEYGVAMATATKALAALRQEGLVRSQPGSGTVVAGAAPGPGAAGPTAAGPTAAGPATPGPIPTGPTATGSAVAGGEPRPARDGGPGLSRQRIVRAAITVADAEGLAAVTMRRLATELGSAPMALYRHMANREDLLDLMADQVLGDYPMPDAGLTGWRPRLEALALRQWEIFRRHPWLSGTISLTRPTPLPNALRHGEWVVAALDDCPLDPGSKLYVHILMFAFVRGMAVNLDMQATDRRGDQLTDEEWMAAQEGRLDETFASGEYPAFAAVLSQLDENGFDYDLDRLFAFALERTLDGLALFIERAGS